MPIKIEQINNSGLVVSDFDNKLTINEIKHILSNQADLELLSSKNPYKAKYKNKDIVIYIKNITYLGRKKDTLGNYDDWEHYKKRIQIGSNFKTIASDKNSFILGIYHYDNTNTFCLFDKESYKNSSSNNASAHIHTMDIVKAKELGVFQKNDKKNNKITVFTEQNFNKVFSSIVDNKSIISNNKEFELFDDFAQNIQKTWYGADCYKKMITANFKDAYQAEWAGFYLEYKFSRFLDNNPEYLNYCEYKQNKKQGDIDLDLWFNDKNCFGDLKCHDIKNDLLGNDKDSVIDAIEKYGKVLYAAFSHDTIKDKECGGVVTKFWNQKLNERYKNQNIGKLKKSDSYLSRMKNTITLKNFVILEINEFNKCYLFDFNQGRNSNNSARNQKISIKKKDIENDNFAIYRKSLC